MGVSSMDKIDLKDRKYSPNRKPAQLPGRGIKVYANTKEEVQSKIDNLLRFCEAREIEFPGMYISTDFDLSEFDK